MVRKTIWGALGTAMVSGLLVLTATAASASPVPPPGGGPPSPPYSDFSTLLSATTTGSAGYAYIYDASTTSSAAFTAYITSCDTQQDGHHSWAELQVKLADTSWVTPDPTASTSTSTEDTSGTGTCSTWKKYVDAVNANLDLRVVTYTMEGATIVHGPAYSSTYVVKPLPVPAVKGRDVLRRPAG